MNREQAISELECFLSRARAKLFGVDGRVTDALTFLKSATPETHTFTVRKGQYRYDGIVFCDNAVAVRAYSEHSSPFTRHFDTIANAEAFMEQTIPPEVKR